MIGKRVNKGIKVSSVVLMFVVLDWFSSVGNVSNRVKNISGLFKFR